jgi:6-pyruvoyltetrahydropterin/6-carboxytetrahydropterin synthase
MSPVQSCTRVIEFDAAHRITRHGSKCAHLHGHRYRVEITCAAALNALGMVVDFGDVKQLVGTWVDEWWDHGAILNSSDLLYIDAVRRGGHKLFVMDVEPTAENIASKLLEVAQGLLPALTVERVRVWETPNCYADATP